MNTKRNLRRKKRTDAVFVSDATWNSCQHGERDTQHVSDVTRHNMSRARDMPLLSLVKNSQQCALIGQTSYVRYPPVNQSITGHCISTRYQDIDLKTWSCYRAVIDSKGWQQMFSSGKGGIKKRRAARLTDVFCPSSKYWGVVPFTRERTEQSALGYWELEMVRREIYCESSLNNKIIWSDGSCTWPSEQIFNLGSVTTCKNTVRCRRAQATMFI